MYTIAIAIAYTHARTFRHPKGETTMYLYDRTNHLTMRDFRAHLKTHLDKPDAFSLGTHYELRAIVLPIPKFKEWIPAEKRKVFAHAKRQLLSLLNQLRNLS